MSERRASPFNMGPCDRCGSESHVPMLWPWIWSPIAPGVIHDQEAHDIGCGERCQCGVLCQVCIEFRLGRPLTDDDFDVRSEIGGKT